MDSPSTHVHVGRPMQAGRPTGAAGVPAAAAATPPDRVAVVVAHGMGQQAHFQTLEEVAEIVRAAEARRHGSAPPVTVRLVSFGGRALPCAEIQVTAASGGPRHVHLYECYWAPLTEGKVTTAEAAWFLLTSGARGMLRCGFLRWSFDRFLFQRPITFQVPKHTLLQFLAALAVIGSLLITNLLVISVVGARVLGGGGGGAGRWPSHALFADLTSDLALGLGGILVGALGALMLSGEDRRWWRRHRAADAPARRAPGWVVVGSWLLMLGALAGIVATATALIAHAWYHMAPGTVRQVHVWPLEPVFADFGGGRWTLAQWVVVLATWAGGLFVNWQVRAFLLQYVGDVAAYVSSHTVSRFNDAREAIKARALETAEAVYRAPGGAGERFFYPGVVVVGHSLGSVIAYDTLNALLVQDTLAEGALAVADRTRTFLTFGSPLDKTAFIYRAQRLRPAGAREALAAAKQPMILDYRSRPARWINIHSRHDWISGALHYYDDPDQTGERTRWVENLEDPEASTPLAAHVEYWENQLLADRLYQAVTS